MVKIVEELYTMLTTKISAFTRVYIPLDQLHAWAEQIHRNMPIFLQSMDGQNTFTAAIQQLINDGILSPVGKKKNYLGLSLKFRKVRLIKSNDKNAQSIIKNITPPASVDYYLKHIDDYNRERGVIDIICAFLKSEPKETVTVNERAYELFGDEKFFRGDELNRSRGEGILKRLGLTYADIGCYVTLEPFFSFYKEGYREKLVRNVYIIENRDTFWSFKKYMMEVLKVDMLIYGEGKKIISSFRFIEEYGLGPRDTFYYFGDLDVEGINILGKLQDEYPDFGIVPFGEGYLALLEIGMKRGLKRMVKDQKINEEYGRRFVEAFSENGEKFAAVLDGGFYVPQEALMGIEMRNRLWP